MRGQGSNGLSWATREELELAYESLARENAVLRAQLEGAQKREGGVALDRAAEEE